MTRVKQVPAWADPYFDQDLTLSRRIGQPFVDWLQQQGDPDAYRCADAVRRMDKPTADASGLDRWVRAWRRSRS